MFPMRQITYKGGFRAFMKFPRCDWLANEPVGINCIVCELVFFKLSPLF